MEASLKRASKTKDGKILLALLHAECGFAQNLMDTASMKTTFALMSKRGVYANLRKYLDPEDIIEIEHYVEFIEDPKKKGK